MKYLEQVQRGVDYIEAHLDAELDLARVSKAAGISHWHFQRIFKALSGETLKTYVRSRRMAGALEGLLSTDDRIIDISLRAGFESQEAFTRAFKQAFGQNPHAFRKIGDKNLFLKKVRFDADYLQHINEKVSLRPELVELAPFSVVGLRTDVYGVDSDKNNIAERLPALWADFLPRLVEVKNQTGNICYGVVIPEPESEHLTYLAGIEVNYSEKLALSAHMESMRIKGGRYARFTHRGPAIELNNTVNYIYSTWLAQSGERHNYGPDLEFYGSEYHPTDEDSVMHYAIPIA